MSFINPNFRNAQKKQNVKENKEVEILDINFDNAKLAGEPKRYDIKTPTENLISLDNIMEETEQVIRFEYIDSPSIANLTGVPKMEELNNSEVAKIQIKYLDKIGNTMTM